MYLAVASMPIINLTLQYLSELFALMDLGHIKEVAFAVDVEHQNVATVSTFIESYQYVGFWMEVSGLTVQVYSLG